MERYAVTHHRLVLVLPMLLAAGWAAAQPIACPDSRFVVEAASPHLQATLCEVAVAAADRLLLCGLSQTRPVTLRIVDTVSHPVADCLAAYDCDFDRIRITAPERYAELLAPDTAYASLPPEVLLRSLLAHELSHALLDQSAQGRPVDLVDHEYVAAAMELDLMPPAWRGVILDAARLEMPREGLINIWIYRLEPRRFSANAWLHFSAEGNGCDLVRRIVDGEATFARPEN
jgi:hypothetical protein